MSNVIPTPQATQEKVNAVYREALVAFLSHRPEGVNNAEIADAITGGLNMVELRGFTPPYAPAYYQLLVEGTIITYRRSDNQVRSKLRKFSTPDQILESGKVVQEHYLNDSTVEDPAAPLWFGRRTQKQWHEEDARRTSNPLLDMLAGAGVIAIMPANTGDAAPEPKPEPAKDGSNVIEFPGTKDPSDDDTVN